MADRYQELYAALRGFLPSARVLREPLRTLAYGTDASFYRLIPKIVAIVNDEDELIGTLRATRERGIPVTFRAAGTSLSGQAISDSVLIKLGPGWRAWHVNDDASLIRLQPGIIGAQANRYLAPHAKKIGPDPASINAAMIGGIAANNASGMCCGIAQNSYNTLESMRVVVADGTLLDTGDPQSRERFAQTHAALLEGMRALGGRVRSDGALAERIRHKYRLKNTTGYSLNALLDFEDPIDVLQHLMIGSEGTLGFIAEITYRTVDEPPHKATALMFFADVEAAARGVAALKSTPVAAVELMDRAGLRSVEGKPGMPDFLGDLDDQVAALLVETRAHDPDSLEAQVGQITEALGGQATLRPVSFSADPEECAALWNIRKGLFPAVGAVRATGTTVIIEDVAFPVPKLAAAVRDLQDLFVKYHYREAILFGHALEGNLHFVFTQDFSTPEEVHRYRDFMDEVCRLVVEKYDGSLKAEHGTGRNMAPYVEMEWGSDAYRLMRDIKQLFDPQNLLNPGVLLNDNPQAHLEDLKPLPAADPRVDRCIECGFCEPQCPSRELTLTPRQRITAWREISRLRARGDSPQRLADLEQAYRYDGLDTCAACGLCSIACPVEINTGDLTRSLRQRSVEGAEPRARWVAEHFGTVSGLARSGLTVAGACRTVLGDRALGSLSGVLRKASGGRLPRWHAHMPTAAPRTRTPGQTTGDLAVVYFPSCASRILGPAAGDAERDSLPDKNLALLAKAGCRVVLPEQLEELCCGLAFHSKGLVAQAKDKAAELAEALLEASEDGRLPVYCDTSPCLQRMKESLPERLSLYEPAEFIERFLAPRLDFEPLPETVTVHATCSTRRMGREQVLIRLARRCAREVIVPEEIGCCGFAGDRGFSVPELNASALDRLREQVSPGCSAGYSTSRTCEIGLSLHSGIHYRSIVYLVDRATRARDTAAAPRTES